jgi:hypothetical protein
MSKKNIKILQDKSLLRSAPETIQLGVVYIVKTQTVYKLKPELNV